MREISILNKKRKFTSLLKHNQLFSLHVLFRFKNQCVPCVHSTFTFLQDLHRVSDFQREAMLDSPSETGQHCNNKKTQNAHMNCVFFPFLLCSYAELENGHRAIQSKTRGGAINNLWRWKKNISVFLHKLKIVTHKTSLHKCNLRNTEYINGLNVGASAERRTSGHLKVVK